MFINVIVRINQTILWLWLMFKPGQVYIWKDVGNLTGFEYYNLFPKDFQESYPYKIQLTESWDEKRPKIKNRKNRHMGIWYFKTITPKDYKVSSISPTISELALTDTYELVFTGRD